MLSASVLLWVVHAAIGITVLEVLWLSLQRARWGVAANALSGLCLMLGLRSVLAGGPDWAVLLWLSLSGVVHLVYLRSTLLRSATQSQKVQHRPD